MRITRMTFSVLLLTVLTVAATTFVIAQATDPPYLAQFPLPARIRNEIKGTDPIDTSARIIAAHEVVIEVLQKMSGERYRRMNTTADENALSSRYDSSLEPYLYKTAAPPAADQPRWTALREKYRSDPAFRDELFRRFFPPGFKDIYDKTVGQRSLPPPAVGPAGTSSLSVVSGIAAKAGSPNPLAGAPVALLKGKARPDLTKPDYKAQLKSRAAAEGVTDAQGRVTLSGLAPGDYYLMVVGIRPGATLPFETPVVVRPGANTITINENHVAVPMSAQDKAMLQGSLRTAGGFEQCKATDLLTNPDCIQKQLEEQPFSCPVTYTGPARRPGPANASLAVIGMGYVYKYTERDRKTGVVTAEREVARGNFINTTLYLLDKSAEEVLSEAGVGTGLLGELGLPSSRIAMFDMLDVEEVMFPSPRTTAELKCRWNGIKSHAVAQMTTDANARGTFPNVPAGTYWLFGRFYMGGQRPAGGEFWNHKIEIRPGKNLARLEVKNVTVSAGAAAASGAAGSPPNQASGP